MSKSECLNDNFRLFCGRANPSLGQEIAEILGICPGDIKISTFPDTELHVQIDESCRGADIYIVQSTCPPVNENLMELLVMIDAFRRASARQITAVIPYYGYARQDHKSTGREPISAKLVADLITVAGANRVISVDLHATQIQGFFSIPMDHLTAVPTLAGYFKDKKPENSVIVSPDVGRAKLADKYAMLLGLPMALMHKRRSGVGGGTMEVVDIVGDVKGKTPIIIDDLIASGSIIEHAKALVNAGSQPACIAVTHPVLVGKSLERLSHPAAEEVIVTNTIPVCEEKRLGGKIKVLSIAPLLAKVIQRVHQNLSVSKVFIEEQFDFPV